MNEIMHNSTGKAVYQRILCSSRSIAPELLFWFAYHVGKPEYLEECVLER